MDVSTAVKEGGGFKVVGKGIVEVAACVGDSSVHKIRVEALHTPGFAMNLISLPTLDMRGFCGEWGNRSISVWGRDGRLVVDGRLARTVGSRKLYEVDVVDDIDSSRSPVAAIAGRDRNQPTDLEGWHQCLVHANVRCIESMVSKGLVDGLVITCNELCGMCKDCILGKQDKAPFNDGVVHETEPLEHVHVDLWGKAQTASWSGALYMMLVSDGGRL
jgi:hypothetical protein